MHRRRPSPSALLLPVLLAVACHDEVPAARPPATTSDSARAVAARERPAPLPWDPAARPDVVVFVKHTPGSFVLTITLGPADSTQVAAFRQRARLAIGGAPGMRILGPYGWPRSGTRGESILEAELAPELIARDSARVARWLAADPLVLRVESYRARAAR